MFDSDLMPQISHLFCLHEELDHFRELISVSENSRPGKAYTVVLSRSLVVLWQTMLRFVYNCYVVIQTGSILAVVLVLIFVDYFASICCGNVLTVFHQCLSWVYLIAFRWSLLHDYLH